MTGLTGSPKPLSYKVAHHPPHAHARARTHTGGTRFIIWFVGERCWIGHNKQLPHSPPAHSQLRSTQKVTQLRSSTSSQVHTTATLTMPAQYTRRPLSKAVYGATAHPERACSTTSAVSLGSSYPLWEWCDSTDFPLSPPSTSPPIQMRAQEVFPASLLLPARCVRGPAPRCSPRPPTGGRAMH